MISEETAFKIDHIIRICEQNSSLQIGTAKAVGRKRERVDARRMAVCIAMNVLKHDFNRERTTLKEIGKFLKKKHSSIVHYRKSMPYLLDTDARLRGIYLNCLEQSAALFDPSHAINTYVNIPQF